MFKLVRYFSITSLIAFIGVIFLLSLFYRQLLLSDLTIIAESKNVALTQAFSNSIWPQFSSFVTEAEAMDLAQIKASPEIASLNAAVKREMAGLSVIKVKIYDLNGLTVFSTDAAQIGEDKLTNDGYLAARNGNIASELTYRDTFSAFEGTIEDRNVFSSYVPIRRAGGGVEGVFEVYDDVTPLVQQVEQSQRNIFLGISGILAILYLVLYLIVRRADQTIRTQHRQLEETAVALAAANEAKTDFLANMSHELRTPLNGILGYAQILRRSPTLSTKDLDGINVIQQSGDYLLTLVSDLLDIAKIEADNFELVPNNLQLPAFLQKLVDLVQVRAHEKGLTFVYEPDVALPETVLVDGKRLQQVLLNMLGNATSYTEQGQIMFKVLRLPSVMAEQAHLRFEVLDTGTGIPAEDLGRIFERFEQVDRVMGRKLGTGLGLPISQKLVLAMGSHIQVRSEVGKGSRFWFDLEVPLIAERQPKSKDVPLQIVGYEGAVRQLLVAEDEASNRQWLVDLLDSLGFKTAVARDGAEALDLMQADLPDLLLLDLVMPRVGGLDVVRHLRQQPASAQMPIIVLSANLGDEVPQQLEEAGGAIFLPKPVDVNKLLYQIGQQLALQWRYEAVGRVEYLTEARLVAPAEVQLNQLYELALAGDLAAVDRVAGQLDEQPALRPFSQQLRGFTAKFADDELIAFLDKYRH